ncbi:MAG: hypothetical protein A2171_01060 [Candidatus Levybacteria bacterium RBG_13_35_9]|nr:MAG: hypothetical protein A2171_01060 [Candidatus Levybacteria bacterium RBG_13_35_9]
MKDLPKLQKDLPTPEKDLPLPEKDLPLPEKEITESSKDKKELKSKWLVIGVAAAVLFLISLASAYLLLQNNAKNQTACTQEAKQCFDGSYVGRTGPNCEFSPCPTSTPDPTADWQIYQGEGFLFKYPASLDRINQIINSTRIDSNNSFGFQIDSQTIEFEKLEPKDKFTLYLEFSNGYQKKDFEIINSGEAETINVSNRNIIQYAIGCGVDCGFYILEFESRGKYYRLLFPFTGGGLTNIFNQILSTFKFTE